MLQLVIIGGKAADKLKPIIDQRFDYVDTLIFRTVPDFCETADMRSMQVDRLFILPDAFKGEPNPDLLTSFNDYLGDHYPAIRMVSLLNSDEMLELFSTVFISPFMVHVKAVNMKTRTIDDLISLQHDAIRTKYGYVSLTDNNETIDEIIDDTQPEFPQPPLPLGEQVAPTLPPNWGKKEKKKGLFSIFGKKNKKGTVEPSKRDESLAYASGIPVYQPEFEEEAVQPQGFGERDESDTYAEQNDKDYSDVEPQDLDETHANDNIEVVEDVDFTMFDGKVNVGVVEHETSEDDSFDAFPDEEFPEEEPFEEFPEEEPFEEFPEEETFVELPEEEEIVESNVTIEPLQEYDEPENTFGTGLDLEYAKEDLKEPDIAGVSNLPNVEEQREKFAEIRRSALNKTVDTSFVDIDVPSVDPNVFNLTDVESDMPIFSDLEDLEQQYNENNIRVVEVERIVERVIEKPVHVGGSGVSKKVYPTGVRTLIFTGDRKSGVTRSALQSALFYGKTEKVLFVDFDVKRKGSLLYYGLENIINEPDNVQNGLINLKSAQMLKHVVYNYASGGFDCLISLYGEEYENEDLTRTQRILSTQKDYSTVVIDCPLENLHLLEDILMYSEIVVCMCSDLHSTVTSVMGLANAFDEDSKLSVFLYNNAKYLLTLTPDPSKFRENLEYVSGLFSLDEAQTDWSITPILGTSRDLSKILNRL